MRDTLRQTVKRGKAGKALARPGLGCGCKLQNMIAQRLQGPGLASGLPRSSHYGSNEQGIFSHIGKVNSPLGANLILELDDFLANFSLDNIRYYGTCLA